MSLLQGRRARVAAGTAGLAMLLGAGACGGESAAEHDAAALAPVSPPVSSAPVPSSPTSASASPSPAPPSASPAPSLPAKVAASIRAARERMAKDGVKVVRPLPARSQVAAEDLQRSTTGTLNSGGIVRVVTAHSDLTGQQELGWVAGGISRYGNDECTQTIKTFSKPTPTFKPNLLICWRVSATKSVVAIVVDPKGHPSRPKALATLDRKWRSMR
jgi:hypothetical protein